MFLQPPREREWISWLWVTLCVFAIFAVVPIARALQAFVSDALGRQFFIVLVTVAALVLLTAAVRYIRVNATARAARYVWLALTSGLFCAYVFSLRDRPEEALHFVEYGLLALLVYRALTHRMRDASIYAATVLCCTTVGILDEAIQWAVPGRYWGFHDIGLDAVAAILVVAAIALSLRPPLIELRLGWRGVKTASAIALVALVSMLLSVLNTPSRIAWYAQQTPALGFLLSKDSVMWEYGYLYRDPDIGVFRSRLDPASLRRADRERAEEAAPILDAHPNREDYLAFLHRYTPISDPFLHEMRVHLFRRDRYFQLGQTEQDERIARYRSIVAYRENQILEKYFGATLRLSSYQWTPERRAELERLLPSEWAYDSPVSNSLVTSVSEGQVLTVFGVAFCALTWLYAYAGRRVAPDK